MTGRDGNDRAPVARERLSARLAEMPFLDRLELAALTGRSRGAVYAGVDRLQKRGMVDAIPHASPLIPPVRRYCLTADSLRGLANDEGVTVDQLLKARPVSARWRRILLERLDGPGRLLPRRRRSLRLSLPRPVPVVPGWPGGRGNSPARRSLHRRGAPGQRRRPGRIRQAAVAAVRRGAARRRAAAGSRRDPAAPSKPGPGLPAAARLPGAGRGCGPRRGQFPGLADALRPRPAEPAGSPGLRASRWGTARRDAASPRIPSRRPGPGLRRKRCSSLPAALPAEARPRSAPWT